MADWYDAPPSIHVTLSPPFMLNVGLIGSGPDWENAYRPALANLSRRLRVRSVYAPVYGVARQVAADLDCSVAQGLVAMFEEPDLKAVLMLDTGWCGDMPARLGCLTAKPSFLACRLGEGVEVLRDLITCAAPLGMAMMPELALRYTPATSRLRELTATKLGRPQNITIEAGCGVADQASALFSRLLGNPAADWIDWCCSVVGVAPAEVRRCDASVCESIHKIRFREPTSGGEAPRAQIRLVRAGYDGDFRVAVRCVNGTAELTGAGTICWQAGNELREENLGGERQAAEVMLDHFARRVVGGLIPVPTLEDACRALELAEE